MPDKQLKKILINGRVQGVGIRYYACLQARQLGITGYVKNLSTGEVEIVAYGDSENLKLFIDAIKKGTTFSMIDSFIMKDLNNSEKTISFDSFIVS